MNSYRGLELPQATSRRDLAAAAEDYGAICMTTMREIVERYERTSNYPFVDTKLSLITGDDFADADPIRGKGAIYGWIQGRGLEALAGHARWLRKRGTEDDLVARMEGMMREVLDSLRGLRERNAGHLCFLMEPDGRPFTLDAAGRAMPLAVGADYPYGFSDLFCAKGMFAAAEYLADNAARAAALEYVDLVEASMWERVFTTDQIALDPKNRVEYKPGAHAHGHLMIQIGAACLLAESGIGRAVERGLELVEHELATYANIEGRIPGLLEGDFWENVDDQGEPFVEEDGSIFSDPGHALEFVGLAGKFIAIAAGAAAGGQYERLVEARERLPVILERNFANGYFSGPKGISKNFDLVSRRHGNTDMPWWNLPETIRAAAYCLVAAEEAETEAICLRVFTDAHNAFREYVRPDLYLMAYQTRDANGRPVDLIPATADADPGYHTGLSLIDAIAVIEGL